MDQQRKQVSGIIKDIESIMTPEEIDQNNLEHLEETEHLQDAPKRRGRPKGAKNKSKPETKVKSEAKIVHTKFGSVIKNMTVEQRRAFEQLIMSGTEPSLPGAIPDSALGMNQGRQLPQTESKADHLLIKGIHLSKNMSSGNWEVSVIETNHGQFGTGEEQTKKLNQELVRGFVTYLRKVFEEDLNEFLSQEG